MKKRAPLSEIKNLKLPCSQFLNKKNNLKQNNENGTPQKKIDISDFEEQNDLQDNQSKNEQILGYSLPQIKSDFRFVFKRQNLEKCNEFKETQKGNLSLQKEDIQIQKKGYQVQEDQDDEFLKESFNKMKEIFNKQNQSTSNKKFNQFSELQENQEKWDIFDAFPVNLDLILEDKQIKPQSQQQMEIIVDNNHQSQSFQNLFQLKSEKFSLNENFLSQNQELQNE